jgi:hypothetical protein
VRSGLSAGRPIPRISSKPLRRTQRCRRRSRISKIVPERPSVSASCTARRPDDRHIRQCLETGGRASLPRPRGHLVEGWRAFGLGPVPFRPGPKGFTRRQSWRVWRRCKRGQQKWGARLLCPGAALAMGRFGPNFAIATATQRPKRKSRRWASRTAVVCQATVGRPAPRLTILSTMDRRPGSGFRGRRDPILGYPSRLNATTSPVFGIAQ